MTRAADDFDAIRTGMAALAGKCICTPVPSQTGLVYSPDPDCPIEAHRRLARELIAAAEGIVIEGRP